MENTAVKTFVEMLKGKGARLTSHSLTIGGTRTAIRGLVPPAMPFATPQLRHYFSLQCPELLQLADTLPLHDACRSLVEAIQILAEEGQKEEKGKAVEGPEDMLPHELDYHNAFAVLMNVESGRPYLWSKADRATSDWHVDAIRTKVRPQAWKYMFNTAALSRIVYDPFRGHLATWEGSEHGLEVLFCNEYKPPQWLDRDYDPRSLDGRRETYPLLWEGYMEHLFPFPAEREAVMDWLALALCSRPISFLSLRGERGNGKSVWMSIVGHLIGDYYEAKGEVLAQFSADLRHKRIVSCDDNENIMSKKGNNVRKNILNAKISYEEKYVQTKKSERQYASLVILSNTYTPFYVEHDERRIVSPTLGTWKLETVCNRDALDWFREFEKDEIESEAHIGFLRQTGESLLIRYRNKKIDPNLQLRGGFFWRDVVESQTSFNRFFVASLIQAHPPVDVSYPEIKEAYKNEDGWGGKKQTFNMFVEWLRSFYIFEERLPLHSDIDLNDKIITINPAFREKVMAMYKGGTRK